MAWSTGVELFEELVATIERHVHDEQTKTNIYYEMISLFEDYDADDLESLMGTSDTLDKVLIDVYGIEDNLPDDEEEEFWDDGGRENFR
jgi:hypothetical protein